MKHYKILLVLFVFLFQIGNSQELRWQGVTEIANTDNQRFDDIFFLNENLGWAVKGFHATVYKTENGGTTWNEQINETDLNEDLYFRNIEFLNENIGFIGTLNNKVYKTLDGGVSWSLITNISPNPRAICGLSTVGLNTVYGCGAFFEPAYIIKSTDSGVNWQYIDMSVYATALVEIKFIDENIGYAAGKNDKGAIILKTENAGLNWTEIYNSNQKGEYVWKLQFLQGSNNNTIFGSIQAVAPNLGKLLKSINGGVHWVAKDAPQTNIQGVGFISETHGWMGGHENGFYETTDAGTTWTDIGVGGNLNRIFVINSTSVFAAGTTIYRYTSNTLSTENNKVSKRNKLEVKLSENPVDTHLEFEVKLNGTDNLLIELYDSNGRFVRKLSRESNIKKQQIQKYSFLVNDLSSGIYVLNLHNNTGRQSLKFIKK